IARALLPSEQGAFSIGHVKALILLGLYNTADRADTAWILAGVAVRIALMLGLHNGTTQRGKHTFMACFMLDSFVSAQIGQLPHMRDGKLGNKLLDSDGLEEWQPWTGCAEVGTGQSTVSRSPAHSPSIFNCLVRISALLNDICCREEEQVALQATVRLQYWANSLPKACHFNDQAGTTTPHLLNLRMAWSCLMLAFSDTNVTAAAEQVITLFHTFGRHHSTAVYPAICASYLALCISRLEGKQLSQRTKDRIYALRSHLGIGQVPTEGLRETLAEVADVQYPIASYDSYAFGMSGQPSVGGVNERARETSVFQVRGSRTGFDRDRSSRTSTTQPNIDPRLQAMDVLETGFQVGDNDVMALAYENNTLERYNSAASIDLDALFEELAASPDGVDRLGDQPIVMQNLGFAPDANLNDVLSADFGQFDSGLITYTQSTGLSAVDQNRAYNGG
ncbi:hypothetical protein LTS18_009124, partial [Coniosporium uncinatum]